MYVNDSVYVRYPETLCPPKSAFLKYFPPNDTMKVLEIRLFEPRNI